MSDRLAEKGNRFARNPVARAIAVGGVVASSFSGNPSPIEARGQSGASSDNSTGNTFVVDNPGQSFSQRLESLNLSLAPTLSPEIARTLTPTATPARARAAESDNTANNCPDPHWWIETADGPNFVFTPGVSETDRQLVQNRYNDNIQWLRNNSGFDVRNISVYTYSGIGELAQYLGISVSEAEQRTRGDVNCGVNKIDVQSSFWNSTDGKHAVIDHIYFQAAQLGLAKYRIGQESVPDSQMLRIGPVWHGEGGSIKYSIMRRSEPFNPNIAKTVCIPLQEIETRSGWLSRDASQTFALAGWAGDYLINNYGLTAHMNFWNRIGQGQSWQSAFEQSYNRTVNSYYSEWESYRISQGGVASCPSVTLTPTVDNRTSTPTATRTATTTNTATPTVSVLTGMPGRGFTISETSPNVVSLGWQFGTNPNFESKVTRIGPNGSVELPPTTRLAASISSFTDNQAGNSLACYYLNVLQGSNTVGNSDLLCRLVDSRQGNAPRSFSLSLNQSYDASLTWSSPDGMTPSDYVLFTLFHSPDPNVRLIPGGSTSTSFRIDPGKLACFAIVPRQGEQGTGLSDILCAIPGLSRIN